VVVAAAANCASGGQQESASLPGCANLLLIGVRGSGESSTLDHGLGATLADLYHRLTSNHPTLGTAVYGLPYAARTTSADTVAEASRRLATIVGQRHQQCPNERLILAGFSLGAEILGDALQNPGKPSIVAAAVLADPRFNPADTATAGGTFEPRYHGDRPRPPYASQLTSRIRSYCRNHDAICQSGDPAADKAEHGRYAPQQTCQALAFIEHAIGVTSTDVDTCVGTNTGAALRVGGRDAD
jgi:hypothetical protein